MKNQLSARKVLILAQPGVLRNSLVSFLNAMPEVRLVQCSSSLREASEFLAGQDINVVLIDMQGAGWDLSDILSKFRQTNSHMNCIVIASNPRSQEAVSRWGAYRVLQHGLLGQDLREAILTSETEFANVSSEFEYDPLIA